MRQDSTPDRPNVAGTRPAELVRAVILPADPDAAADAINLRAIFAFIAQHWLRIGASALLGAAISVAVSYAFPRKYRAEVLLAPVADSDIGGNLRSLAGRYGQLASAVGIDLSSADSSSDTALALLQSRGFLEDFITDKKVMSVLYPGSAEPGNAAKSKKTLQDAYRRFVRSILLVKRDKGADLVILRIDWRDRRVAADWANSLEARLNEVTRKQAIEEADRSLSYLRAELKGAEYVQLKDSISSLIEAQVNKRMLATTRPDYSFRVLDRARPPDANKSVAPKRVLFLIGGLFVGGLAGCWLALRRRDPSAARRDADQRHSSAQLRAE
jgi:uncharacterized protein involved in exopolysaccharide biosynthesis